VYCRLFKPTAEETASQADWPGLTVTVYESAAFCPA